jgi:TonB-dependent starch-binding outer membrane protein SusC
MDATVIKGYYTTTKRFNTGNVSSVNSEIISKQPIANPLSALQGMVPGVLVTNTNGLPGSEIQIQIRGQNSIAAGNNPLYIIDGVPFTSTPLNNALLETQGANGQISPMNSINPSDIESIEVLKDADATSIYGSRGANGVVLITTKKGKSGKTEIDLNVYSGRSKITRFLDVLNTEEYLTIRKEAYSNDGGTPTITTAPDLLLWDSNVSINWQKIFLGETAKINDCQISISGGSAETKFLFSSNYRKETTIYPGDFHFNRGGIHFNFDHTAKNKKLFFSFSGNYICDKNILPYSSLIGNVNIFNLPPNFPLYDPMGNLNWQLNKNNPIGLLKQVTKNSTNNLIGNMIIRYTIFPGLNFKTSLGYNKIQLEQVITFPRSSQNPSVNPTSNTRFANNTDHIYCRTAT